MARILLLLDLDPDTDTRLLNKIAAYVGAEAPTAEVYAVYASDQDAADIKRLAALSSPENLVSE